MGDHEPTIRSRELGDGLRQAMERAGLNGKTAARSLGWSESRVSRLLTGRRGAQEGEVVSLLTLCGVGGEERERLLRLCKDLHTRGWFQQFGVRLPRHVRTLIDHESNAAAITAFAALTLPDLLQTSDYALAVISRGATVPAEEIEDRVAARAARQIIFSRPQRPGFSFFLHEFALRLPAASEEVLAEQLHHLLRMAARPYLTIRVIPAEFGAHAGLAGSCTLLESPDFRSVVYLESETTGLFLERPEEIAAYRRVFAELSRAALGEGETRELITGLARDPRAFVPSSPLGGR